MAVTYRISELAADLAVTTRTIRFYEEQGLIAPSRRGHERIYTSHEHRLLRIALTGKQLGMPLAQCRELLALYQTDDAHAANEHLHNPHERIQHYQQFLDEQKHAIAMINETLSEIKERFQHQFDIRLAKTELLPSGEEQPSLFHAAGFHTADSRIASISSDADSTLPHDDDAGRTHNTTPAVQSLQTQAAPTSRAPSPPVQSAAPCTHDLFVGVDHHDASSADCASGTAAPHEKGSVDLPIEKGTQLGFQL